MNREQRDKAIAASYRAGNTAPEIAAVFALGLNTVLRALKRQGVAMRGPGKRPLYAGQPDARAFYLKMRDQYGSAEAHKWVKMAGFHCGDADSYPVNGCPLSQGGLS